MKRIITIASIFYATTACSEAPAKPSNNIVYLRCNGLTSYDTSSETTVEVRQYRIDKSAKTILSYFDNEIDSPIFGAEITDRNIKSYHESATQDSKSFTHIDFDLYAGTVNHRAYSEHTGARVFTIQVNFSGQCEKVDGPPTHQF